MKRLALVAAVGLAAALAPLAAWAGPSGLQLTEAGGAKFPERAFVLSLPGQRALSPDSVQVSENGQSVVDVSLVPASAAGKTSFGAVLVVDASDSMRGRPIQAAMAAARAFAARRNPTERLALVTFNTTSTVALPFTTSAPKIDAALAQAPPTAYGTHIYDAVKQAETLLQTAHVDSGSIVVLSDGADTGSTTTAAAAIAASQLRHVRIFTVGLHSSSFDPSSLRGLAAGANGAYALARTTGDLSPLFDQLGGRLASEYLLRYKSLAGPSKPVNVSVTVNGLGRSKAAYRTPALPVVVVPPYHPSLASRFWSSAIVMVVLALFAASVVAVLAYGILQPRSSTLPRRMAEFVSVPGLQHRERRAATRAEAPDTARDTKRPTGLLARLDEALQIAQIRVSATALVISTLGITAFMFLLLDLATGSGWWALLALLVPVIVREFVARKLARRRKQFAEQLPDSLQVISAALRSGHSFAGALAVVVESSGDPMRSEMQRVVADEQLGVPLETAVAVVVRRMDSRDLEQVALVAELQRETGGNAAEVVDRVAETVRERFELRRLINTLTIQGRMSRWIVTGLPVALLLLLSVINPQYIHPLVAHLIGRIMLGVATAMVIAGSLVIKRIVDIKV